MMKRSFHMTNRNRRGFTLIEIIIVGVLIAGFSSLAIFAIREQFESNKTKATIGETRQIATALEFANLDTGIFPKLHLLAESAQGIEFLAVETNSNSALFAGSADIYSRQTSVTQEAAFNLGARLLQNWQGPYFALSPTRRGFAQGRGGYAYMTFPDLNNAGLNSPTSGGGGYRWPTDPNNNPYMVYMLDIEGTSATDASLAFVNEDSTDGDVTRKGNFVNAVVSYGRNGYPGGQPVADDDFPINQEQMFDLRLYERVDNTQKSLETFRMRPRAEFTRDRANIWSRRFAEPRGLLPVRPGGVTSPAGMSDPTSDDVVFEF